MEIYIRPDGLRCRPHERRDHHGRGGWPYAKAAAYKADVGANYLETLRLAPEFADRVRAAPARRPSWAARFPVSSAHRSVPVGHWWAMRGTTRIPSPPRASATPSVMRSSARPPPTHGSGRVDVRRGHDVVAAGAVPRRHAHLRVHQPAGHPGATAARDATAPRSGTRKPRGDGRFVSVVAGTVSPVEFFSPTTSAASRKAARRPAVVR